MLSLVLQTRRRGDAATRRQRLSPRRRVAASSCLLFALLAGPAFAQPHQEEPPVADQPADFNGAVGRSFQVRMRVAPTEVQVGDAVTLTVQVRALGAWQRPPNRPRLDELKSFKSRFQVDRPDAKKANQPDRMPDRQTWEFDYRLRPLSESVNEVPPFPFVYYRASGSPRIPGSYQSPWTKEVPLQVKPRIETVPVAQPPIRAPSSVFQIAEGPEVLRRDRVARLPSLPVLAVFLVLPPLVAALWFLIWCRLFPDAARRTRQRQSGAARYALHALQTIGPVNRDQRVYRVTRITAGYLQQRLGLPTSEPTPVEVANYLGRFGSPPLAGKAAEFFRACDAARFAPRSVAGDDLAVAAKNLILTLEEESWPVG